MIVPVGILSLGGAAVGSDRLRLTRLPYILFIACAIADLYHNAQNRGESRRSTALKRMIMLLPHNRDYFES